MGLRIKQRSRGRVRKSFGWQKAVKVVAIILAAVAALGGVAWAAYYGYERLSQDPPIEVSYGSIESGDTNKPYFAPVHIDVKHVPTQVHPGEKAKITIAAGIRTTCSILVDGERSQEKHGLHTQKTDKKGAITWTWQVSSSAQPGYWPLDIACKNPEHSASATRTIQVVDRPDKKK